MISKYKDFRQRQISKLAYYRFLSRNKKEGQDKEDWQWAEKSWLVKYLFHLLINKIAIIISLFTIIVLCFQVSIESSNFVSLNRPFVEIRPIDIQPDSQGRGEDASQVWCYFIYNIRNFGPVPAYNVRVSKNGFLMRSKVRGEFNEEAIPGLKEFRIGWLAPNSEISFPRTIIYTDAKSSMDAYRQGLPLEIKFKIEYDGPKGLFFKRHYWYQVEAQYKTGTMQILNTKAN
jgi:hypothetical protein